MDNNDNVNRAFANRNDVKLDKMILDMFGLQLVRCLFILDADLLRDSISLINESFHETLNGREALSASNERIKHKMLHIAFAYLNNINQVRQSLRIHPVISLDGGH
ncbi:hypothetical protein A3Q56_02364 [Intoshia linei]|uniref:Uncharacterized protein n=1 Tax=Intoshia linei TaxID=1819745 RepID=A0A177B6L8_9BILA|nr:hypothetical protein A3Q56_02364 [Intoshia linei]